MHTLTKKIFTILSLGLFSLDLTSFGQSSYKNEQFKNVILILSDDHRFDFLGFHENSPNFLETPNFDRMSNEGAHMKNAFVTTSLCSPSRATILTGQYMHQHKVVDNQRAVPDGTRFFPEYLQEAGILTAYIGKWHMGHDNDNPRKGFDHWASFKGQGVYFNPEFNINGNKKKFDGYNADITTDLALNFLKKNGGKRFYLQVGYKAVHYPFQPAKRHLGRYDKFKVPYPQTMSLTERNYETQPNWIRERRYGIHGIGHMETGPLDNDPVPSFPALYRRFAETVHGLDENVGRILNYLDESGLAKDTLVLYLGDNGFALGEHGFYDKRDAFEESIRIPMLAYAPGRIKPGTKVDEMVLNLDIAQTVLAAMKIRKTKNTPEMSGRSFLPLIMGKAPSNWRKHLLYEYHWEWNFPATPTTLAIRTNRYKYIYYHGIWDKNGLYDLQTDPHERHNLIRIPAFNELASNLKNQLFNELGEMGGLSMPIRPPKDFQFYDRKLRR
ncbi:MAG: acetylglucosamine-6-sulfatase [Verrucomicrobiales bacterium]|nr:acetylglucosamine-6-sulfatase [Verrucomicrobiales bacterium]